LLSFFKVFEEFNKPGVRTVASFVGAGVKKSVDCSESCRIGIRNAVKNMQTRILSKLNDEILDVHFTMASRVREIVKISNAAKYY
jgi:hypothetical protein